MEKLWKLFLDFKISINNDQKKRFEIYLGLFLQWNQVHNLTSIRKPDGIFTYHFLDCILGLKIIESLIGDSSVYDLGSGGGFPGLVAAILWPEKEVFLVESLRKKTSFLRIASTSLKLNRVKILEQRAESLRNIDFAITRAAFSDQNMHLLSETLSPNGKIAFWMSESMYLPENSDWVLEISKEYNLEPGHKRKIVVLSKRRST